jgi:hypothetical protein
MKISEILLELDIPSKEIKTRFQNKNIKLNGEITDNIDLDINLNFIMDLPDYLCEFYSFKEINDLNSLLNTLNLKINDICNTNLSGIFKDFTQFYCLTIAKNQHYLLLKPN